MDDRLDDVIDSVAREMTDAEPSPAFRATVLDAIRGPSPQRARPVRLVWVGATAAVAVLAVAGAIWTIRGPQSTPATPPAFAVSGDVLLATPPRAESPAAAQSASRLAANSTIPGARSARRQADAAADLPLDAHEPSAAFPALIMEPLSGSAPVYIDTISIEPIAVTEVTIEPLQIDALDSGRVRQPQR